MPTVPGPFGNDKWQEDLHLGLQDQFWKLLKNRGEAKSPRVEQMVTLFFLGEVRREWIVEALTADHNLDLAAARAMVEVAYKGWRHHPTLKNQFNRILKQPTYWEEH
jgi:hypothetical protein